MVAPGLYTVDQIMVQVDHPLGLPRRAGTVKPVRGIIPVGWEDFKLGRTSIDEIVKRMIPSRIVTSHNNVAQQGAIPPDRSDLRQKLLPRNHHLGAAVVQEIG